MPSSVDKGNLLGGWSNFVVNLEIYRIVSENLAIARKQYDLHLASADNARIFYEQSLALLEQVVNKLE